LFFSSVEASRLGVYSSKTNMYTTAWARLKHQAEQGNSNALFTLGSYYYQPPKGSHIKKNLKKSAEFYFKAAIRGNAAAQYNFAILLNKGLGVTINFEESYVFFKLASKNESPVAMHTNLVASKSVKLLEGKFDVKAFKRIKEKIEHYEYIIEKKSYRKAKFPK